jgi:DNA-binding MarR family transcriptional regulator
VSEHLNSACEQTGVTLPLARALQFLADAEGPVTPTQLSRELGRSPAATSELVNRLIKTDRITADVDPNDRRSFKLALTRTGRAKWDEVRSVLAAAETTIERDYGKRRLNELASAVEELAAKLDGTTG